MLARCCCHSSVAHEGGSESNGRLEFLGDAVVQLYVTDLLYRTDRGSEGVLTAKRQNYVSRGELDAACESLELIGFLRYSVEGLLHGEPASHLH